MKKYSSYLGTISSNLISIWGSICGIFEYQIIANLVGAWVTLNGEKVVSHGVVLNVNNNQITNSVKYHLFSQKYEVQEFNLIQKYFQPNIDVVEFGGGIGFISCIIGKKINPLNKHIVVEPNPFLLRLLNSNKLLNNCNFKIISYAYSSHTSNVLLGIGGPFESGHITTASKNTVEVPSINLKEMVKKYDLNQFFLVADVEGKEFDLIKKEFQILSSHCPMVLIEFHDQFGSMESMIDIFIHGGYSCEMQENTCLFIRK